VRGRFGNRWLSLSIALTGLVATMPYIALQLVGLQVVIGAMGVTGEGIAQDIPLFIAFAILAAFHLFERNARAGGNRHRQGPFDLCDGLRRGGRHPDQARRFLSTQWVNHDISAT
jgi:hypothetical protein